MINWETIKSLYNDKPTLMEWLKKVEAALNGATLTSVSVNTISVGVITLTFEFDDGTSITTPNINLPQGAQGVSVTGASIVAGKLILTLSNGTTIDAGNTGAVLGFEIDNSQHLIVKYQDGTSEDLGAIFTGNANITGDLSVGGNITNTLLNNTEDVLRGAADISNYYTNEGDITLQNLPTNIAPRYAHWRVSNGKLSIVVNLFNGGNSAYTQMGDTIIASINIPSWVGNKLFAVDGTNTGNIYSGISKLVGYYGNALQAIDEFSFRIFKNTSTELRIQLRNVAAPIACNSDRSMRIEANFML